jgi:crotonobetainyl-CoA:carnitine CoA-transferase CaiB-like acyl-CoA transferase
MSDQPAPPLPLAGLRVLDLTRLLPGAFGTLLLADQGADVVKVEEPGRGDYLRWLPPRVGSVGAYFVALNRGKRSVALDLKRPAGRQAFLRLATRADAVIEGFRPGVADRLGVGDAAVRAVRPDVVYCSLSGYGQDGPYRDRAGHDLNYLGYVGLLALSGPPAGPPVPPPTQIADLGGGLLAAFALTTALLGRARTGQGAYLDLSLLDGALAWALLPQMTYAATGRAPARGEHELAGGLPCYADPRRPPGRARRARTPVLASVLSSRRSAGPRAAPSRAERRAAR